MKRTYVTVSEMQDFLKCQWRWYAKYRLNRVPRKWSPALILGTAVHDIFERHFNGDLLPDAFAEVSYQMAKPLRHMDPAAGAATRQAHAELQKYRPQIVGFTDRMRIDETLEVEKAFELPLHIQSTDATREVTTWYLQGRPDRVVLVNDVVYHYQHKTLAANRSPDTFSQLVQRSMHEGLYGYYLAEKYNGSRVYGGTILNVVLKKVVEDPAKGGFQTIIKVDEVDRVRAWLRASAIVRAMVHAEKLAYMFGIDVLIDNPLEDGGPFGNSLDGYLPALTGKRKLDDPTYFMDREERYVPSESD